MSNPQVPLSGSAGSAGPFPTLGNTLIVLADANHTLADPSETCYQSILVTGPQTAPRNLVGPLAAGFTYIVTNETTGGFPFNFGGSSGSQVGIPPGQTVTVKSDGAGYLPSNGTVGTGINEFGGTGTVQEIPATETILGSGSGVNVKGSVTKAQTTDGVTFITIASYPVPPNSALDFSVTLVGVDVTTNPTSGAYFRADIPFSVTRSGTSSPVLHPNPTVPQNIPIDAAAYTVQAGLGGSGGNSVVIQVMGLAATTVNWVCALQDIEAGIGL